MNGRRRFLYASVISIHDSSFLYPACRNCFSRVIQVSQRYNCHKCSSSCEAKDVHYRYKLSLGVADDSQLFKITVFGSCLEEHFGISADALQRYIQDLTQDSDEHGRETAQNLLFQATEFCFIGRNFIFGVKSSEYKVDPLSISCNSFLTSNRHERDLVACQISVPTVEDVGCTVIKFFNRLLQSSAFKSSPDRESIGTAISQADSELSSLYRSRRRQARPRHSRCLLNPWKLSFGFTSSSVNSSTSVESSAGDVSNAIIHHSVETKTPIAVLNLPGHQTQPISSLQYSDSYKWRNKERMYEKQMDCEFTFSAGETNLAPGSSTQIQMTDPLRNTSAPITVRFCHSNASSPSKSSPYWENACFKTNRICGSDSDFEPTWSKFGSSGWVSGQVHPSQHFKEFRVAGYEEKHQGASSKGEHKGGIDSENQGPNYDERHEIDVSYEEPQGPRWDENRGTSSKEVKYFRGYKVHRSTSSGGEHQGARSDGKHRGVSSDNDSQEACSDEEHLASSTDENQKGVSSDEGPQVASSDEEHLCVHSYVDHRGVPSTEELQSMRNNEEHQRVGNNVQQQQLTSSDKHHHGASSEEEYQGWSTNEVQEGTSSDEEYQGPCIEDKHQVASNEKDYQRASRNEAHRGHSTISKLEGSCSDVENSAVWDDLPFSESLNEFIANVETDSNSTAQIHLEVSSSSSIALQTKPSNPSCRSKHVSVDSHSGRSGGRLRLQQGKAYRHSKRCPSASSVKGQVVQNSNLSEYLRFCREQGRDLDLSLSSQFSTPNRNSVNSSTSSTSKPNKNGRSAEKRGERLCLPIESAHAHSTFVHLDKSSGSVVEGTTHSCHASEDHTFLAEKRLGLEIHHTDAFEKHDLKFVTDAQEIANDSLPLNSSNNSDQNSYNGSSDLFGSSDKELEIELESPRPLKHETSSSTSILAKSCVVLQPSNLNSSCTLSPQDIHNVVIEKGGLSSVCSPYDSDQENVGSQDFVPSSQSTPHACSFQGKETTGAKTQAFFSMINSKNSKPGKLKLLLQNDLQQPAGNRFKRRPTQNPCAVKTRTYSYATVHGSASFSPSGDLFESDSEDCIPPSTTKLTIPVSRIEKMVKSPSFMSKLCSGPDEKNSSAQKANEYSDNSKPTITSDSPSVVLVHSAMHADYTRAGKSQVCPLKLSSDSPQSSSENTSYLSEGSTFLEGHTDDGAGNWSPDLFAEKLICSQHQSVVQKQLF